MGVSELSRSRPDIYAQCCNHQRSSLDDIRTAAIPNLDLNMDIDD
jgi:hypothetical protein